MNSAEAASKESVNLKVGSQRSWEKMFLSEKNTMHATIVAVAKLLAEVMRERLREEEPHHNTGNSPRIRTPLKVSRADKPGALGKRTKPAATVMTGM